MCNRYRIEVEFDELWHTGPAIRNNAEGERELINLVWGMPSPPTVTNGKPDYGVTNIRNLDSPHWRGWTGVKNRCLVPWTAFCEYEDTKPKKTARWFAIDDKQPLAFFAGIWTPWKGARGSMKNPRVGEHELYGFLTCEANAVVKPIHAKAMPVLLTSEADIELWMTAEWHRAKVLQRPYPNEAMTVLPVENSAEPLLI